MKEKHQWTKGEMKKLINLWRGSSLEEMAGELGVEKGQIQYIAGQMRLSGIKLARKHSKGRIRLLIEELKKEMRVS